MSKKTNNMAQELAIDSDDEMVEADPKLQADYEKARNIFQGPMNKYNHQMCQSLIAVAKTSETINNSKLKLKERFRAKSRMLEECQQKMLDVEQSRDSWKTEAEQRKVAEEGLKAENNQQAFTIKNLNKELERHKQEISEMKINLDSKLKESESSYEKLRKKSEEDSKKLKQSNQTLREKLSTLERTNRDLEVNSKSLRVQISNLENDLQHITTEKEQVTAEKDEGLLREIKLKAEVASRDSIIDHLVMEEVERRKGCSTMNQIIFQHKDHYKDFHKKKNVSDVNLTYIMPEMNCSIPQKRSPLSVNEDGGETVGKRRKATPRNSGHVSEEEGEIVNLPPQPQQEVITLPTPIPFVPVVGALPQTLPRCIDNGNGTSVNANVRHFQTTPNPVTSANACRDNNRRNADWSKHGGRGRKY